MLTYGSVCSGIEAVSVAWNSLSMNPLWFSEIEPFPCAVLNHHYPDIPNIGDMRNITNAIKYKIISVPDILVGGTPCQSFSVIGSRKGLSDNRGQLMISYVDILNEIDKHKQSVALWENVPGILSSKDNSFGYLIGLLAGENNELQPTGRKWTNAGIVFGPKRTVAWRVFDAQYFGLAQRRKRVYVVASASKRFSPYSILFESEGVRRDVAPIRRKDPFSAIHSAFAENSRGELRLQNGDGQITGSLSTGGGKPGQGTPAIFNNHNCVRRLTPLECERLQGFPDNWTQVPWRGKLSADCPDGLRYKAIGNSMATNVMRWLGERTCL